MPRLFPLLAFAAAGLMSLPAFAQTLTPTAEQPAVAAPGDTAAASHAARKAAHHRHVMKRKAHEAAKMQEPTTPPVQ